MIPFIRSLSELMLITESRDTRKQPSVNNDIPNLIEDSGQRKRYIRSLNKNEIELPELPKKDTHKSIHKKDYFSRFINTLDYNNQIQSSYDLTLLEIQNKRNQQDVA
ncbi:hypothetical protein [Prochlorococcus marinus]|uniref:hypothetical protein n=1 Tax=Prochlorococcus marinus TaxID=1219 RepID=UPI0022B3D19E|nr:hypothetical protein [Prochlorococcus marinus]